MKIPTRTLEWLVGFVIIMIIGFIAVSVVATIRNEHTIPAKDFTEPSASVTLLGRNGSWALYKLSVHGHDETVWVYMSQSSVVRVPSASLEKP